jgi:threonine dehydratase
VPDLARTVSRLSPRGVAEVEQIIRPYVRLTPVVTIDRAELGLPGEPGPVTLKLEQLQHSGSFKARGAFANLLLRDIPPAGILGVPARIFVPEVSSPAKVSLIRAYGADLVVTGATYSDALATSQDWARDSGALQIHAFNQAETILGAGSVGLELASQAPDATSVLVGVGGGGLLAGVATAYSGGRASARVVGVEPEDAPTMTAALAAGCPVDAPTGSVAVDSLAPRQVGELTLAVTQQNVDRVLLVSDAAILAAQLLLWERLRIVAEPGACAALAALLSRRYSPGPGEHVAVVISGANTTAVDFGR